MRAKETQKDDFYVNPNPNSKSWIIIFFSFMFLELSS